jgi:hypothetical protein
VTTDLLSVWTDPDTAMYAVGTSLGIAGERLSGIRATAAASPLHEALYDVLLTLVDEGELETRACADGRYAFRWRADPQPAAVSTDATSARLAACLAAMPREVPWHAAPASPPWWHRLVATTAPLALPTLSCLLVLVAYVVLGPVVGHAVLGALALVGVVGVVRRVPLAWFWTTGLIVAGLLMRLS